MKKILSLVDRKYLDREIYRIPLASHFFQNNKLPKKDIASFIDAYYGFELLEKERIRHILLTTLPVNLLRDIAQKLNIANMDSKYDLALLIASDSWTKRSKLPKLIKAAIKDHHGLLISDEYLPTHFLTRLPKHEEIVAESLPPLFDFQLSLSERIEDLLSREGAKGMLQMPTGSGKTRTVMHALIRHINKSNYLNKSCMIWLAHTEELCEQAIESFKRSWLEYGSGIANVYRLFGSYELSVNETKPGIVFASLQKLHSLRKSNTDIYQHLSKICRVLIFDEAHKALATTYNQLVKSILSVSNDAILIGLSATPGRAQFADKENKKLASEFDNNLIKHEFDGENSIDHLRKFGVLAKLDRKVISGVKNLKLAEREIKYLDTFFELPPSVLQKLSEDIDRNNRIVKEVVNQVKKGNQCMVFACGVDHSKIISSLINLLSIRTCSITSDMKKTTRARYISAFRNGEIQALVNYGILTTGFDAPNIGAVFITRPTKSIILYSQMIGRGLRGPKVGGNDKCVLVDVLDNIIGFGRQNEVYDYFSGYW